MTFDACKYPAAPSVRLPDRSWPDRSLDHAPIGAASTCATVIKPWPNPWAWRAKLRFFEALVRVGFKEIEVGFPAASQTEFDFVRALIDEGRIPAAVTIQVLTQAREDLIAGPSRRCGVRRAIVHVYNSTSDPAAAGGVRSGSEGVNRDRRAWRAPGSQAAAGGQRDRLEYSPESFTGTELEFAAEVCDAVAEEWRATPANKMIVNLPATVEMSTPNVYADQIEWMHRHLSHRVR